MNISNQKLTVTCHILHDTAQKGNRMSSAHKPIWATQKSAWCALGKSIVSRECNKQVNTAIRSFTACKSSKDKLHKESATICHKVVFRLAPANRGIKRSGPARWRLSMISVYGYFNSKSITIVCVKTADHIRINYVDVLLRFESKHCENAKLCQCPGVLRSCMEVLRMFNSVLNHRCRTIWYMTQWINKVHTCWIRRRLYYKPERID